MTAGRTKPKPPTMWMRPSRASACPAQQASLVLPQRVPLRPALRVHTHSALRTPARLALQGSSVLPKTSGQSLARWAPMPRAGKALAPSAQRELFAPAPRPNLRHVPPAPTARLVAPVASSARPVPLARTTPCLQSSPVPQAPIRQWASGAASSALLGSPATRLRRVPLATSIPRRASPLRWTALAALRARAR